jgi:type I restriction enzyme S subunit
MVETKFKHTDIGLIPEEWEVVKLGEIGSFTKGKGISKSEANSGNIPAIRYGEIYTKHNNIIKRFYSNINEEIARNSKELKKGDLLFAGSGETKEEIGKTVAFIEDIKAYAGGDIVILRPTRNTNSSLLGYLLNSQKVQNQKSANGQGDAVVHIYANNLKDIQIPLPPLPEQQAIAEVLSDTDAWIESLEKLIAKKQLIKQGAMQQLLTPKEDWEVKRLGEVCAVIGGGTPSTFNNEFWNGNINWFTPTEVGYKKYLTSSNRKISEAGLMNSSANMLPINSILLTTRAGIGDVGILKIEACTNQGFQSLVCHSNTHYEFIYYLMQTKKNELLNNASGSTFLEISPNKVKSIEIQIPSLPEQTRIATILSDMDIEIEALKQKLAKAKQVKQGLMQELLTGRTRIVVNN